MNVEIFYVFHVVVYVAINKIEWKTQHVEMEINIRVCGANFPKWKPFNDRRSPTCREDHQSVVTNWLMTALRSQDIQGLSQWQHGGFRTMQERTNATHILHETELLKKYECKKNSHFSTPFLLLIVLLLLLLPFYVLIIAGCINNAQYILFYRPKI